MKRILLIGGKDPCGYAGESIDIKTLNFLNCHPFSVITTLTTQNENGSGDFFPVGGRIVKESLDVFKKFPK